ncbi:hypothetical protein [Thermoactinomyces sp. CICC 23799]|jgi:hypothetical protein|uniref:hypothetical protein n=1 Tax=Thermoactinomyces sp. CICC 23799 TaxID=2767429 RepID=UPI0018DC4C3D|nr:hypothetical protein [Thermoactinomyces sp. CICC 23799]MBH8601188.1 hypothetical protein [Thermoactinomyces sp. CICC 23799]
MRQLKTSDIFRLSSIIRKLNLKKELAALNAKEPEKLGLQLFLLLFENLDQAEEEITSFFADLAGKTPDQFKEMSLEELGQFMDELRQVKGLGDFFRSLFKTEKAS